MDSVFKKNNGVYYTNSRLANKLISYLKIDYCSDFSLIEPAVGEGHILSIIVEKYFKLNVSKNINEKVRFLEKNIVGFDIRKDALYTCRDKLNKLSKKYIGKEINWNLKQIDILNSEILQHYYGKFDYVISNPPYVTKKNLDLRQIDFLKNNSLFCNKYNYDLYYYFIEIGLNFLTKRGRMVYITPNSFLRSASGKEMLKNLLCNRQIEQIIDFEDSILFEDANTYTAITIFSFDNQFIKIYQSDASLKKEYYKQIAYTKIMKQQIFRIYNYKFDNNDSVLLGEIADIRNGLATLQDKVFCIKSNEIVRNNDVNIIFIKNNIVYSLEKKIIQRLIRPSNPYNTEYVIFPYNYDEFENRFVPIKRLEQDFPQAYTYLNYCLSIEYKSNYGLYFGRTQGFRNYSNQKIIVPKVAHLRNCFSIIEEGYVKAGLSIVLHEKYTEKIEDITEYLNSLEVSNFLQTMSKDYNSGYKSISSTDLKNIEIPRKLLYRKDTNYE